MLGDLISEEKGRITSQRVLDVEGGEPKIETSFSATGNYRGVETTATVTYWGALRPGGAIGLDKALDDLLVQERQGLQVHYSIAHLRLES